MRTLDGKCGDEQRDRFVSKGSTHTCQHSGAATTWNNYHLINSSCYGVLGVVVKVRVGHDGVEEDVLDVTKEIGRAHV